ncbi:hypothetical protein CGRA01v4_06801 [Colletotrichum graminicola]|nr:hypothetical protein CGRA01v4_06801 [Colletotrichum graminicola]
MLCFSISLTIVTSPSSLIPRSFILTSGIHPTRPAPLCL